MLFIFDWDGTVIDSTAKIIHSMQRAIASEKLPYRDEGEVRQIIGLGLPEAIRQLFPQIEPESMARLRACYSEFYIEADQTPCQFYPDVRETLTALREQGYRLAVATGKSRKGLDRVLSNLGMGDYFDATRCADETRSKPHPQMVLELLSELAVSREQAVMVGDTSFDLDMATNAGIAGVGVSYGAHPVERLQRCSPAKIIDRFADLQSIATEFAHPRH